MVDTLPGIAFSIKWNQIERASEKLSDKTSTKHQIRMLCDIARVSLSGYYAWKERKEKGMLKEDREQGDRKRIESLTEAGKGKWGYRSITMRLNQSSIITAHSSSPSSSVMNNKKVLRLMKKYGLLSKIRRRNPYRDIQKATQEHSVAPNVLNREFGCNLPKDILSQENILSKCSSIIEGISRLLGIPQVFGKAAYPKPYTKLGTDITYIRFNHRWVYLSVVKDIVTGEALGHFLSMTLELTIVEYTYESLIKKYTNGELIGAINHSDQGFHYTHPSFPNILKQLGCIQSMSRRGNCIDNAPTESFFGHMKDELDYSHCTTFKQLQEYFDEYMYYYNNNRPQWTRKKMTPVQYRNHLLEISK